MANLNPGTTRTPTATTPMTPEGMDEMIVQCVASALVKYETQRNSNVNGDTSNNSGSGPRVARPTQDCTYKDFLNCQPLKFNETEGVVAALTWWNSHMKYVTQEVSYAMPWKELRKMMTAKYCPRSKIKKLKVEILKLKVKGTDLTSYTLRFQELALMSGRLFPEASDEVERLKKRKHDDNSGHNQNHQQPPKKQNVARAYTAGPGNKKEFGHLAHDYKAPVHANAATTHNQGAPWAIQRDTGCYECGAQGHFKRECLRLRNNNHGNQNGGNGNTPAKF
ncbi:putative reverse transcriptase domain-containing protein [Tanacetum coccineum]